MKLAIITLLFSYFPLSVYAQTPPASASQLSPEEQTILQLERELAEVYTSRDAKTLEQILSDDYTAIWGAGRVFNKQRALRLSKPPSDLAMKYTVSKMNARVWDNVAVATGILWFTSKKKDKIDTLHVRVTDTFLKRGTNWQLVASHHSDIPWWQVQAPEDKQLIVLTPLNCSQEPSLRSPTETDVQAYIKISNQMNQSITVQFLDYDGKRKSENKTVIQPGKSNNWYTYLSNVCVVTDGSGKCLGIYMVRREPGLVVIK